jgi:hypothetical protein
MIFEGVFSFNYTGIFIPEAVCSFLRSLMGFSGRKLKASEMSARCQGLALRQAFFLCGSEGSRQSIVNSAFSRGRGFRVRGSLAVPSLPREFSLQPWSWLLCKRVFGCPFSAP